MRTPRTNQEWQDAVNAAAWCLAIDSAKQYGLIDTDMTFNVERCLWILRRGRSGALNRKRRRPWS